MISQIRENVVILRYEGTCHSGNFTVCLLNRKVVVFPFGRCLKNWRSIGSCRFPNENWHCTPTTDFQVPRSTVDSYF